MHAHWGSVHQAIKNKNAFPFLGEINCDFVERNVIVTQINENWGQRGVLSALGSVNHKKLIPCEMKEFS